MEAYIMVPHMSTKKYLVLIWDSAYEKYGTIEKISNIICGTYDVTISQNNIDLTDIYKSYIVA